MEKHVTAVETEDTVESLEKVMNSSGLSCVPVVDSKGDSFGIVSTADLVLFHSQKRNPKAVRAWEMCTYRLVKVGPDVSVKEAARLMLARKIHHLIVISGERKVQGIISSLDIVAELLRASGDR
jgi:predicted transcriptional regulator